MKLTSTGPWLRRHHSATSAISSAAAKPSKTSNAIKVERRIMTGGPEARYKARANASRRGARAS
jgi:hypothetical protein